MRNPIRFIIPFTVIAATGGFLLAQTNSPAPGNAAATATARKALDYLLSKDFSELAKMFGAAMKENVTPDVLRGRVGTELASFGKPEHIGEPVLGRDAKNTLVSFPVDFTKEKISVQFQIDESGQLAAIHFRPADAPLPATWQHAPYSKPDTFHEREATIGVDPWKLGGTLTVPNGKGPFPAVILVHGPGPNDRDESLRAEKPFADLAEGLASRGIAVLRYDKRTKVYGRQMRENAFTLREETTDDAVAAAAFMRLQPEVNTAKVYILGHSLGGYAAPRIAKQDGKLAGVIFLAANARPVEELVMEQTEYLKAAGVLSPEEAQKRLDSLKVETEKIKALQPGGSNPPVVLGLPAEWLLDVKNYDPPAQARSLSIPLLFLQGERDFQVSMKDFERWKSGLAGRTNVTFHSYPELNHLFIAGMGKSLPADYAVPANVSPKVIGDIADWIAASKK